MKVDKKVKIKFAFLPVALDDDTIVFLKRYREATITIEGKKWVILSRLEDVETDTMIGKSKYYVTRGK